MTNLKLRIFWSSYTETAINIGYSCRLLTDDMEEVFIIDEDDLTKVKDQLEKALNDISEYRSGKHDTPDGVR